MAINTGRRIEEKNPPARTPYTTPPTYKEPVKPLPPMPINPPVDLGVKQQAATQTDPIAAAIQNQTQHAQPMGGQTSNPDPLLAVVQNAAQAGKPLTPAAPTGATPPPSPSATDDYIKQYMEQIFGGGRSFDPISDKITGQRDDALRSFAENMASRGLGASGALGAGAGDIYNKAGENLASSYQDWRGQGINEMKGALAPYIEKQLAAELMGKSTEEKIKIINAQRESIMKQLFGEDYDPNMGSGEMELFASLLSKLDLGTEEVAALQEIFKGTLPEGTWSAATEEQNLQATDEEAGWTISGMRPGYIVNKKTGDLKKKPAYWKD